MKKNELVPLSVDLELAPIMTPRTTLGRSLAPLIDQFIADLAESTQRLRRLAAKAEQEGNAMAEAALADRLARHATRILKLFQAEHRTSEPPSRITYDEIPAWDEIPASARKLLDKAFEAMNKAN